ncbi:MAG TPA: AraC family transcriptional regulator [Blastocatellia bacterium]|nr:AraC family transcriptional regulator [Blastocatellia bacterium]
MGQLTGVPGVIELHGRPVAGEAATESPVISIPRVEVIESGKIVPIVSTPPRLVSGWKGVALEAHSTGAYDHPDHEHPTHFLQLQLKGPVRYRWTTDGITHTGIAEPGTLFLCPRGSRDRVEWDGPTDRVMISIEHAIVTKALEETAARNDVELQQSFEMRDRHIASLILALRADSEDGSPAGHLYGESLVTALAVYLQKRLAVFRPRTAQFRGGMPTARLRRVLEFIEANLGEDISLSALAEVAGMGPHYFSDLFKQSTGLSPHQHVLRRKMERAKEQLQNQKISVVEVSAILGFTDQSYFTKVFRRAVGVTPTEFRANQIDRCT